jgi:rhamnosyltransferase
MNNLTVSILIPTLNAGKEWLDVLQSINNQSLNAARKIIIDSGSKDDTAELAKKYGFEIITIDKKDFNHGKTRQQLVDLVPESDICVFLTQDAILASADSIEKIVSAFDDETVGLAYGRQLPHKNAKPLEIHARLFNYPDSSVVRSYEDKDTLGFKVFFCSNSFSAYRRKALLKAGGFPSDSIMGEDALVSAKMLMKGYKIAYVAEAAVHHSHSYTLKEEFRRYFDTRVFHEQNKWLIETYGKPTGEGLKFVKSELTYSLKNHLGSVVKSISSIFAKWLGYNMAKYYKNMPVKVLKILSMHSFYWH